MSFQIYIADWVLPVVAPPIRRGAVVVNNEVILDVGPADRIGKQYSGEQIDFEHAVIAPSWINAHTHLELSYLRGKVPAGKSFVDWIRAVVNLRAQTSDPEKIIRSAREQSEFMVNTGTVLAGDITNGYLLSDTLLDPRLNRIVFYELLGFQPQQAKEILTQALTKIQEERSRAIPVPHAPYSASAELITQIARLNRKPQSIHAAESADEREFLEKGQGAFVEFLKFRGVWLDAWQPPGVSPIQYLDRLGYLQPMTLLVHGVQVSKKDLEIIAGKGCAVCICARSNHFTEVGRPPLEQYLEKNIPLCVGSDSLASNDDLDMNNELYYLYQNFKFNHPAQLIRMATVNGARALGRADNLGKLEKGARARLNVFISDTAIGKEAEEFVLSKSWSELKCI